MAVYFCSLMKKIIFFLTLFASFHTYLAAQNQYEVSRDEQNGSKVLKGIISRELLEKDTAFSWFQENQAGYTPYPKAVEALKQNKDILQLIVFSGTWCGDSKTVVPKLYALMDSVHFPQDRVTLLGVDRSKKTLSHLAEAFNITGIPTIIVMKEGKEVGRVVEYGKYGLFDMELAEIINRSGIKTSGN